MKNDDITYFEIFPWHKNFETGITVIDAQHQQLVHILNRLAAHLANRASPVLLNKIFDELAEYAEHHFKTEEKIWKKYFNNDIWFTSHEKTHDNFSAQVEALKNKEQKGSIDDLIQEIVSFLSHWLANHILNTDKRMAKAVLSIESGNSIEQSKAYANEEMAGSMQILIDTVLTMYDSLSSRTMDLMREKSLRQRAEDELKTSEERWRFVLEAGTEGLWDCEIGTDDSCSNNGKNCEIHELNNTLKAITGQITIHEDDLSAAQDALKAHLEGETPFYNSKHRILNERGGWSWVSTKGKVVSRDERGNALRMIGTHTDITEKELSAVVYNNSAQAMFVTDANNKIISVNPAFTRITGYSEEEALGSNTSLLKSGRQDDQFYKKMWQTLRDTGHWEGEIWNRRKNGEVYPEMLTINSVTNSVGEVDHRVALFFDITDKKIADELIVKQANHDSLTGLPNRRMLYDRLEYEIKRCERSQKLLAVLFVDLDRFKEVNDFYGHDVGDELLKEAAQRINRIVRDTDTVSRLGGDEFTIILANIDENFCVSSIAQEIIVELSKPFSCKGKQAYVSASIGITIYPDDAKKSSNLLKNADRAMYMAKTTGRGRYCYFTPSMQKEAQKRQSMIRDLRSAIEHEEFEMYYQPIVDLHSSRVIKAEGLIRWNHQTRGVISPVEFIPLAEETTLIVPIGHWVFKEAISQAKQFQTSFGDDFQISINVSPIQFRELIDYQAWLAHLKKVDFPAENCVIEITEGLLVDATPDTANQLIAFNKAGIQVALDDFGTGYSSLAYIKKFDIDYIKIDRTFVKNMMEDKQDVALCEAMIEMAHKLNLKVIAEGIETIEQQQLLKKMGCDFGQGYFYSPPVPAEVFEQIVNKRW